MRSLPITLLGLIASVLSSQGVSCTLFDSTFAQPIELRPATSEIESLVRQALEDRLEEEDLPDIGLLGKSTRIAVRQELPATGLKLSQSALPGRDGYDFHLISVRDAQSEAERTQMAIYFITVDRPTIAGDTATIWLGVDFVLPPDPNIVKSCCCVGEVYRVLPDMKAAEVDCLWVIDESGGDYLYPADRIVAVDLPEKVRAQLLAVATK